MDRKHCLIIDSSDIIRKVACHLVEGLDLKASEVDTGENALERCRLQMPDAIMVDWRMPDMTGTEFISSLASETQELPYIIYCATENDPKDITAAFDAGADSYMLKPLDRESIKTKLMEAGLV